mmetsp:Transcript_641/g.1711  ORF Transcript_641/g.1711 Transcript_641/m.1711 type:complete len:269 (-) Transcript_641:1130-1936(-)
MVLFQNPERVPLQNHRLGQHSVRLPQLVQHVVELESFQVLVYPEVFRLRTKHGRHVIDDIRDVDHDGNFQELLEGSSGVIRHVLDAELESLPVLAGHERDGLTSTFKEFLKLLRVVLYRIEVVLGEFLRHGFAVQPIHVPHATMSLDVLLRHQKKIQRIAIETVGLHFACLGVFRNTRFFSPASLVHLDLDGIPPLVFRSRFAITEPRLVVSLYLSTPVLVVGLERATAQLELPGHPLRLLELIARYSLHIYHRLFIRRMKCCMSFFG